MISKGLLKEFQGPLMAQDLTADEHNQMPAIAEKTMDISQFLID